MVQTVQDAVRSDTGAAKARLDPNYSYLRVTIGGRLAFLALGYVDSYPQGPIEVYYSAQREVVRLQSGRVVGVVGLTTEWRNVSVPDAPSWAAAANAAQPLNLVRIRDVMPGYRFGVRDELALQRIAPPVRSELQGLDPKSLNWFEEHVVSNVRASYVAALVSPGEKALPPARYAVDLRGGKETVVYGEQCITPDICFTWQRWSAEQQSNAVKNER